MRRRQTKPQVQSTSVQRLRKACSELIEISVSFSDWIDSYALCDSLFTYLTRHVSVISMTEKVICISTTEKAMFNHFVYFKLFMSLHFRK